MKDKDIFKDIFSKKLENHEVSVNPELWSSISSKITSTATTSGTVTGISLLSKIIIGSSVVVAISVGTYLIFPSPKNNIPVKEIEKTPLQTKEKQLIIETKKINKEETESLNILLPPTPSICISINPIENEINELIINDVSEEKKEILNNTAPIDIIKREEFQETKKPEEIVVLPSNDKIESFQNESSIEELPNIFTPNNDGINDILKIKSSGLSDFSLVVLDSKNHIIYKTEDPNFNWNGITLNGEMVEEGNYIYFITAFDNNGKAVTKYNTLKVVR